MTSPKKSDGDRAGSTKGDHFIPFRRSDVVEMCVSRPGLDDADRFRRIARIVAALFHQEFQGVRDDLLDDYAPFDPDRDTLPIRPPTNGELAAHRARLVKGLAHVLERGNWARVSTEEIERAMVEESLFRIRLDVGLERYEELLVYRRGERTRHEEIPALLPWRRREIEVPTYERVLLYVQFVDEDRIPEKERKDLPFEPGSMVLKLFSDIPRADLEMLFPGARVRMRTIDKLMMGVPAILGGAFIIATKLAAVIGLVVALVLFWLGLARDRPVIDSARIVALGAGIAAFASWAVKQWMNYKNRKLRFLKTLTENLYFKSLANNAGVLRALIDRAESEEVKEAIVACRFLLEAPDGLTCDELDERVEGWLRRDWEAEVDFDAEDALEKLRRLGVARLEGDRWRVLDPESTLARLESSWCSLHRPGGEGSGPGPDSRKS